MSIIRSFFRPAVATAPTATPANTIPVTATQISVQRPHLASRRQERRERRAHRAV